MKLALAQIDMRLGDIEGICGRMMQSALACAYASYDTPSGGALLERRGPQPVQVAVGIDGTGLGTAGKKRRGLHAGLKVMDL